MSEAAVVKKQKRKGVIRRLAHCMHDSWKWVWLTWLFVAVEVVCEVLIPWVAGSYLIPIINPTQEAIAEGYKIADHVSELWGFAGIMLGLAFTSCASGIAAGFFAARASRKIEKNVRKEMFHKIQELSQ